MISNSVPLRIKSIHYATLLFSFNKRVFSDDPNLFHFEYRNYNKLFVNIPCVKQKLRCFKFQCLALAFCAEIES